MTTLKKWSTKNLEKLKQAAEQDIITLQGEIPSNDAERVVISTLLQNRKATIAEVKAIVAERQEMPRSERGV